MLEKRFQKVFQRNSEVNEQKSWAQWELELCLNIALFSQIFSLLWKFLIESSLDSSIKQQALLGKMIDFLIKSIHARLTRIARFILEEFFFCAFPDLRFRSIPRYWTIHYGIFFSNYLNFPRFSTYLSSYLVGKLRNIKWCVTYPHC